MDLGVTVMGFFVGLVVGLTGMGGGALMTPALIFLGVNPTAAVANDLVAASINKSVGASVHWRRGSPNLRLAGLLICGSVPFAFAGGFIGYIAKTGDLSEANLRRAVVYGSVMGSFAVEKFSIERLMTVSKAEIDARVRELRKLVTFEEELPA